MDNTERFVYGEGDIEPEDSDWDLTLDDGDTVSLVETAEELRLYLDAAGMTLAQFEATDKAKAMPPSLRRAVTKAADTAIDSEEAEAIFRRRLEQVGE